MTMDPVGNASSMKLDRLSPRHRPSGCAVLHQRWDDLVFLHWRFAPERVRALVPAALQLDLFDGAAWVGMTPFTVSRMRPTLLPPLPVLSDTSEINLRTYVHRDGVPGLWFFSLDASNALAVRGARALYRLPYFHARMRVARQANAVRFHSERTDAKARAATLDAAWETGERLTAALPDTLAFFLLERYVLYAGDSERMLRARIHHRPWPLREARITRLASTMLEAAGLPTPDDPPVVHAQGEPFDVAVWPPVRVGSGPER
jgi:uncharacterized protein YqjF (DUF2071 family)